MVHEYFRGIDVRLENCVEKLHQRLMYRISIAICFPNMNNHKPTYQL